MLLMVGVAPQSHAQGPVQRAGQAIDQGVNQIGNAFQQGWDEIRNAADRMGVQARVYARLHWDKMLQPSTIDIDVPKDGTIVLRGSVASRAAKEKAYQLANDTVGVHEVVNQLVVAPSMTPPAAVPPHQ
jgi:osmotically-inducible protein OsmY